MGNQPKTSSSKYKWFIGIGIVLLIIWAISSVGRGSTKQQVESTKVSAPTSTPSPQRSYPPESIVTPEELNSPPKATSKPNIESATQPLVEPVKQTQTNTTGACKYSCSSPDRDCADFSTHAEAQEFFNCCDFTASNDPMKLDSVGVGDGVACESLP